MKSRKFFKKNKSHKKNRKTKKYDRNYRNDRKSQKRIFLNKKNNKMKGGGDKDMFKVLMKKIAPPPKSSPPIASPQIARPPIARLPTATTTSFGYNPQTTGAFNPNLRTPLQSSLQPNFPQNPSINLPFIQTPPIVLKKESRNFLKLGL